MHSNTQLNNKRAQKSTVSATKSTVPLAEWMTLPGKRVSSWAAFLPARDEVLHAVMLGYDIRTIYTWLHDTGRYPGSYETFRRCVQRAQRDLRNAESTAAPIKPKPTAAPADGIGGFAYGQKPDEELY